MGGDLLASAGQPAALWRELHLGPAGHRLPVFKPLSFNASSSCPSCWHHPPRGPGSHWSPCPSRQLRPSCSQHPQGCGCEKWDLRKNRQLFWQESSYLFTLFLFFYVPGSMNILLVKYQYLEAQISGKFVKQKKVGEYLVFSLFSYRQQRPPPLSLSNHYHLLFCKRGLGKPQNFIFRLPNSNSSKLISWQKKTPQKCWDGMQRKLHILQQRWEPRRGK